MSYRVRGVGINDVPGITNSPSKEKRWLYSEWSHMLERCYSESFQQKNPTYIGCTVCDEWKYLSNFVKDAKTLPGWVDVVANNYRGMNLDKDGLIVGNREYSKNACQWLTCSDNAHERNVRCGSPFSNPAISALSKTPEARLKQSVSRGVPVIGIDPQGNAHEWYSTREAERQLGISNCHTTIQQSCAGGSYEGGVWKVRTHTKSKGKLKGWSFYWKDDYNSIFNKQTNGGQVK